MTRELDLLEWAAWATARALRPRPGDVMSPGDARAFASECRARARAVREVTR